MKKIFTSLMVLATLATAFSSCTKEKDIQKDDNVSGKMKTITVKTSIDTRTTLDTNHENIIWTANDKISIFNDVDETNLLATYAAGEDLVIEVPEATEEIYAHYPYYNGNESGPKSVSVYISNKQTQTNPGELNGYNFPMVAKGTVSSDNKALISLYPVASALALNIYHTGLEGEESVKSVKVTPAAANTKFTGSQSTNLTGDNITYTEAASSDPITVTLTNELSLGNSKPADKQKFEGQIYVCLAKQSYANVKFEIETTKGTYTITSSATPFDCVNNDFVPVNINLAKAAFEEIETIDPVDPTDFSWVLVKDALAVDDLVVIAAAGSEVAMSTEQKTNNRGQIAITKSSNSLTANANVQVFKVVSGTKSGTVALKCMNGDQLGKFIAAASSNSNNMHSNAEIDDNASWSISIDAEGVAAVVAQGTNTRNTIRYNSSNSLFSCYASQNNMADVVFYRAGLPSANLSFPEASYTVNLGETFTAPELSNPYGVSVAYSSSASGVAEVNASTGAVSIVSAGTAIITASFAGNSTYSASEASYEIVVVDPTAERWVKTAIGSITTSDVFVIVGGGYAVTNDNGTESAPAAEAVSITGDALTNLPGANLQWKVTGDTSTGYSFSPANNATIYLYCNTTAASSSNNNIRVGSGDRNVWEFDSVGYMKTKDTYTVRYFSKYNNQDWRGYVSTSNGAVALEFYVKQGGSSTPTKTLSSITVTPPSKTTYTVGDAFDATGMVVTATYSDATTADVTSSATTDFTTQVATAGNKTVTVSYTEDGITKTDTFDITVNPASGTSTVTFTPDDFSGQGTSSTGSPISLTKDGITVACDKGFGTTEIRCYAGSVFSISSENGKTITAISFTFSGDRNGGLESSYSGLNTNSWEQTLASQARFSEIVVTYK